MDKRKILVTSALPYANGSIHIGHLVEYIQTDIWVRFQKLRGHECYYMCADDTHGTPVMLSARKQGITPDELVARMQEEHVRDFDGFNVAFDNYYTTNSEENRAFSEEIYLKLKDKGHIAQRTIAQTYCPEDKMFLPDRMIRGTCPSCGAEDQYGDSCEICSATYNPTELKDARCAICSTVPETRESEHYFFQLSDFEQDLKDWVSTGLVQDEIANKLEEWFKEGLRDWDISRDAPYFGFKIPGTDDKYFYVWLDAPIGYMASTKNWCDRTQRDFDSFWLSDDCEIVHFIGKDIAYFHTLFWPAMLKGADYQLPDKVYVHGFLTVDGQKMSKSRGTFISAADYLEFLDPEWLRFYYACKLTGAVSDIDLNLTDFVARVNADIGNQFVNLGSRVWSFLGKRLEGRLGVIDAEGGQLLKTIEDGVEEVADLYEKREFSKAMKKIISFAHLANQFVANRAPWAEIKEDEEKARSTCTAGINAFAKVSVLLAPVLPVLSAKVDALLDREPAPFSAALDRLESRPVNRFEPLFVKVQEADVDKLVEASKERTSKEQAGYEVADLADEVTFDQFLSVDLRVARVLAAEGVKKADKLVKLTVDLGPLGQRTIFAGIKKSHQPEELVGRTIIVVANLAARKMKFGLSEGMLLACGPDDSNLFLASLEEGARPGDRIS